MEKIKEIKAAREAKRGILKKNEPLTVAPEVHPSSSFKNSKDQAFVCTAIYKAGMDLVMEKLQAKRFYFDGMIQELVDKRLKERLSQFLDQIKNPQ